MYACERSALVAEAHGSGSSRHSMLSTQHSMLSTQHSALNAQYSALSVQCSVLSIQYSMLITQHSALNAQYSAPTRRFKGTWHTCSHSEYILDQYCQFCEVALESLMCSECEHVCQVPLKRRVAGDFEAKISISASTCTSTSTRSTT